MKEEELVKSLWRDVNSSAFSGYREYDVRVVYFTFNTAHVLSLGVYTYGSTKELVAKIKSYNSWVKEKAHEVELNLINEPGMLFGVA